jgi:NADH:ubiquinone oxidoreductase subunit 5 (subunit L)/multisubunit Na+/H+ antiporter MnhA subunit
LIFWGRRPLAEELDARPGQDPAGLIQYSLTLLAIMAISVGMLSPSQFWGALFGIQQMDTIGAFLSQTLAGAPDPMLDGALRWQSIGVCVGCAFAGIGWAVFRFGRKGYRGEFEQPALGSATELLREALFVEQAIDRVLVRPLRGFSRLLLAGVVEARILDRVVVSGGAGVARRMVWSGLRRLQNGRVQSYAMLGVIALLLSVVWLGHLAGAIAR